MKPVLLFDLDDTLLQNSLEAFLPAYLEAWARFIAPYIEPRKFLKALQAGTQAMESNLQPNCTLKESFEAVFYPLTGFEIQEFEKLAERFYLKEFPTLKKGTSPIPGAAQVVKQAIDSGYPVAIATNPFFPLTAIEQRLSWSGLAVDQYPFQIVSSYERFHYSKSHPAFYTELLAHLGWPDVPAVMIGDDLQNDIFSAQQAGLQTYWIAKGRSGSSNSMDDVSPGGELSGLLPWLESTGVESLKQTFDTPSSLLAVLHSTPAFLDSKSRLLTTDSWRRRPGKDQWSPLEIICHLRDVDQEVNLPRLDRLMEEDNPFLPSVDTNVWAEQRQYNEEDNKMAMAEFLAARIKLIGKLEALQTGDWSRPARHALFSRTDLGELAGIISAHDRLHIQQFLSSLPFAN